ncbi:hypothetical protein E2320_012022 [Naja naja]|nr:hypothetical protein E2320_012022 [Naja naja]
MRAGFQPFHDMLQVTTVAAALAPHKEALDHVVAHGAHAGTLPAPEKEHKGETQLKDTVGRMLRVGFSPVTNPSLVAHRPLAAAAVDVQGGGGLVEAVNGPAGAQFDHFIGDVPQLKPLQQVNVRHVPMYLCLVINPFLDAIPQHNQDRHGHLDISLLGIEEQHVVDNGAEEIGRQAILVEGV